MADNMKYTSLFKGVSESELLRMYNCLGGRKASFKSGEVVFEYIEPSDNIGIVIDGSIVIERTDIFGSKFTLDIMEKGDVFGETIAFSNVVGDSICVVARSECEVIFISMNRIAHPCTKVCECHSQVLENLLTMISLKARKLGERVEVMSNKTIREKLMYYFMLESAREKSRTFTIPFSISVLAEYICADRSAMTRELANMKRDGLIHTEKRTVTLLI